MTPSATCAARPGRNREGRAGGSLAAWDCSTATEAWLERGFLVSFEGWQVCSMVFMV